MSECCNDFYCRRRRPVLIRLAPFSRRFIAATSYSVHGDLVSVSNGGKHDVHEDVLNAVAEFLAEQEVADYDAAIAFLRREARAEAGGLMTSPVWMKQARKETNA
jgi:hypothetical protein